MSRKHSITVTNPVTFRVEPLSATKSKVTINSQHQIIVDSAEENDTIHSEGSDNPATLVTNPARSD